MSNSQVDKELLRLVESFGSREVAEAFTRVSAAKDEDVATIIVNEGLHLFPETLLLGDVHVMYRGSLAFEDKVYLHEQIETSVRNLAHFLLKKKWKKIYILISGHAIMCMLAKLVIFRITHIESIDVIFDGSGNYINIEVALRRLINRPDK